MKWRQIQRTNIHSIGELVNFLELDEENQTRIFKNPRFVLNLPLRLASKIRKNALEDPLFRQFVPLVEEKVERLGFVQDPVGDKQAQCTSNLLHKYEGRALLVTTGACAMHCRYCFRQHYPYASEDKSFKKELDLIRSDSTIEELILSGGDPLSLSNATLEELLKQIHTISHIKRVRFHSRFIVGIPERIDAEFLNMLQKFPFQYWFIVHVNHPRELDEEVFTAFSQIQKLGIPVLNQSVLLKGVNDQEEVLRELFGTLSNHGVFAYYLHQLDRVQGGAHFEVEEARGRELIQYLERSLPGYAVPKYVREVQGQTSKVPLS